MRQESGEEMKQTTWCDGAARDRRCRCSGVKVGVEEYEVASEVVWWGKAVVYVRREWRLGDGV